jgi:TM2 domain-containing membrane protein YozV
MMRFALITLLLMTLCTTTAHSQRLLNRESIVGRIIFKETEEGQQQLRDIFRNGAAMTAENPRLVAICLNISLGLFGVHRMYLGTELYVPIAYTFTIGGGCVLWIADLVLLITAKDITPYLNNPNMFMWTKD